MLQWQIHLFLEISLNFPNLNKHAYNGLLKNYILLIY